MRQRVMLAPRNAGEAVALAVTAVLLVGSGFAVAHRQLTENDTVNASFLAAEREVDVRTVSTPGPRVLKISVDGSRLPHVPVFISDAPEVLANVVTRNASPRTDDRASDPTASSPLLGALGEPHPVTTPTGMPQTFPVTMPPTTSETSSPSSEPTPTTEPTTSPDPTETPSPTDTPTTPPTETTTAPPTTEPEPEPSPDTTSDPTPDGETSGITSDPAAPADPTEPEPVDDGDSSGPDPESNGPESADA